MKNLSFRPLLVITTAALIAGCVDQTAPGPEESNPAAQAPNGPNTSDPSKPNFDPSLPTVKREVAFAELDHTPGYKGLEEFRSHPRPAALQKAASAERWVGVLPLFQSAWNACPAANRVRIHQDDEDDRNFSMASTTSPFGAQDADARNTQMLFCKVPGHSLRALTDPSAGSDDLVKNEFAVLKLDDQCPDQSLEFAVRIDNEDSNNRNSNSGNMWPNYQNSDYTQLHFCWFKSISTSLNPSPRFPTLSYVGGDYAVFANQGISTDHQKQTSFVISDDEDNGNLNQYLWMGRSAGEQIRIKKIVKTVWSGTSETTYFMAAVKP